MLYVTLSFTWRQDHKYFTGKERHNWKCSGPNIVFQNFFIINQFLKWKVSTLIMHMCLICTSSPLYMAFFSRNINSSRAVNILCLPISIDFLLWTALTTKSRNYKNNLRVFVLFYNSRKGNSIIVTKWQVVFAVVIDSQKKRIC